MSNKPEIQEIPIDPGGRYVIVVSGMPSEDFAPIAARIKEWWESEDSVLILCHDEDMSIRFVRIDNIGTEDEQEQG